MVACRYNGATRQRLHFLGLSRRSAITLCDDGNEDSWEVDLMSRCPNITVLERDINTMRTMLAHTVI